MDMAFSVVFQKLLMVEEKGSFVPWQHCLLVSYVDSSFFFYSYKVNEHF